jgi:hypothetical protein
MLKRIGAEEGGEFKAIASGTLPSGKPVIVNADGTVSVVAESSDSAGSGTVYETGNAQFNRAAFDSSNNKVVIVYQDTANSLYGTAVVGTVSNNSISFGTPVVFASADTPYPGITFDSSNNKIVVVAGEASGGEAYNAGRARVGTVSGTSISFGTGVVFNAANTTWTDAVYDSGNGKIVIAYKDQGNSNYGTAVVGTVSGTSISFGSEVVWNSGNMSYTRMSYDINAGKVVIVYRDNLNSSYGTAIVGTVSGTSISFGSEAIFSNNGTIVYEDITYDSTAQKHIIVYADGGDSSHGKARVGTVSGTSITFGTEVEFEAAASTYISVTYDSNANKTVIMYRDQGNSNKGTAIIGTVSGTNISFGTPFIFHNENVTWIDSAFDSNSNKIVVCFLDGTSSVDDGTGVVINVASANLTSENYIGMSRGVAVQTGSAASVGSPTAFVSADSGVNAMAFDSSNNKILIAYRDTNNQGYAVVATVSGSSVSFGTPVAYYSGTIDNHQSVVFDSNVNKFVVFYGRGGTGKAKVGTVSGTSVSFGSEAEFDSGQGTKFDGTFDSTNNKVVVTYTGTNNYVEAKVGTISGTSISFGTAVVAMSLATDDNRVTFDSNRGKVVICSRISTKGRAAVGTVSGTSISFASNVIFADNQTKNLATTFDSSNNKVVIAFQNGSSTDQGQVVVGDIDGSGVISFGSAVQYNSNANSQQGIAFDSNLNKIVIAYDATDTSKGQVVSGTVSGTSITFDSEVVFDDSGVSSAACAFDSNANKILIAYQDDGNSFYGTGVVFTPTSIVTTRGEVADGGNVSMDIIGSVSDNQIGLTAGQQYFVQTDGTISTTADSPSVLAGTAISATELVVKT